MNNFQLPPLSNEYIFEQLICDIFNETCKSNSYQIYGNRGNSQFGIDICSLADKTVIQCKKKDSLFRKDTDLQNELIRDLEDSMEKIKDLPFGYNTFILATTTKKYPKVQQKAIEYAEKMQKNILFWDWGIIAGQILQSESILKKYGYQKFITTNTSLSKSFIIQEKQRKTIDYFEKAQKTDNLQEKVDFYKEALELNPKYFQALFEIGKIHFEQGKFEDAIAYFNRSVKINPDFAEVYNLIGLSYKRKHNKDVAIENFRKAIRQQPNFLVAYYNLSEVYFDKGNYKEVISILEKALEIDPNCAEIYYRIGRAYFEHKNFDKAIESYQKVLALNPNYPNAWNNLQLAFIQKG